MLFIGKLYFLALSLFFVLMVPTGCLNSTGSRAPEELSPASILNPDYNDTIVAGSRDTLILLKDGQAFVKGHLSNRKSQRCYVLPAWNDQTMTAVLTPLSKGKGLRISQLIQPGGVYEGPFGDTLHYKFRSNGNMKIFVGQDTGMKVPYTGDFLLQITLK